MNRHLSGAIALALFIVSIPAANLAFQTWGAVPVLFGLYAPAAALVVGFTFLARDYIHKAWGAGACLAAIAAGTVLSMAISPALALASGAAFLFSELADLLILQRLQRRGWSRAVTASNIVGAVVDSVLFLLIAFGSLAFLAGQLAAKLLATLAWLAVRELRRQPTDVGGIRKRALVDAA